MAPAPARPARPAPARPVRRLLLLALAVWVGRWAARELAAAIVARRPPHEAYRR